MAIWIQMFLYPRPELKRFWKRNTPDYFVKQMNFPRDDWYDIFVGLFHLSDETIELTEKELNRNFKLYWNPYREVAIDESMRLFKGKWNGKVYIKSKPTKWELKYYLVVDCVYYCYWFELYKGTGTATEEVGEKTRKLVNKVVDVLPREEMGAYKVYGDNYYGSLDLAKDLFEKGFLFTFNCQLNRPGLLFKYGLHKRMRAVCGWKGFTCRVDENKEMAAVSWTDKKTVNFMTNQFTNETEVVLVGIDEQVVEWVMECVVE
jgi:hypothetical protein